MANERANDTSLLDEDSLSSRGNVQFGNSPFEIDKKNT